MLFGDEQHVNKYVSNPIKAGDIAQKLFSKANDLRAENKYKEAAKEYLNSIMMNRNNPKAYFGLGLVYKELNNYKKSNSALKKAGELSPFDSEIFAELGISEIINGNFPEAIKAFQRSIKLNPENYDVQIHLAMAHELADEEDMALMIYQRIIEKNPSFLRAYIQKASLCLSLEYYVDSACLFRKVIELDPAYSRAYLGIAICCDKMNKKKEALRYYKKFLNFKTESVNTEKVYERISVLKENFGERKHSLKVI